MLISPAYAQAAGGEPSFLVSLLPLILIFVVFWFLLIRPQQKRMREHREMVQATKKGDKIVTSGGIYGTVARVIDDNALEVEIAPNVKVKLARGTISENMTRAEQGQTPKAANDGGAGGQKKGLLDRLTGR
jgi:preprotein translocase subunit YajC